MKLTSVVAAILGLGLVSNVHGGVKTLKVVNGVQIVRVKTMGIFCPSTTTICYYPTNTPGVLYTINSADSSGVLGQVAGAAGQATSGALIHPARTDVKQGVSSSAAAMGQGGEGGAGGVGVGGAGGAGGTGGQGGNAGNPGGNNGNGGNPHFN